MHIFMYADRTAAIGGIETHISSLATELLRHGQEVTVAFQRVKQKSFFDEAVAAGARLVEVDSQGLRRYFETEKIDVFHAHTCGATRWGGRFAQEFKTPMVVTVHGPGQQVPLPKVQPLEVICVSEEVAQPLRRTGRYSVRVIQNGVDLAKFRPDGTKGRAPNPNKVYAAYLGRVGPSKKEGIRALEKAVATRPEIALRYLSNWAPEHKEHPTEDVHAILQGVDIVFSTGRGVREAMSCGAAACVLGAAWDGLVTPENVEALGWHNFSGRTTRSRPTAGEISVTVRGLLQDRAYLKQLQEFSHAYATKSWDLRVGAFHTLEVYRKVNGEVDHSPPVGTAASGAPWGNQSRANSG